MNKSSLFYWLVIVKPESLYQYLTPNGSELLSIITWLAQFILATGDDRNILSISSIAIWQMTDIVPVTSGICARGLA